MRVPVPTLSLLLSLPLAAQESPPPALPSDDDDAIVVTTGTRCPEDLSASTLPVAVIEDDDAARHGRPLMPTELLERETGAYATTIGGIGSTTGLRLRGTRTLDTQVRYDDVPLSDPVGLQSSTDLAWLNPAAIGRSELVRGPQSGLYGSRAIGGVVNLIGPRPTWDHRGDATLQGGSFGTIAADARATGPIAAGAGYAVAASALRSDGITAFTDSGSGDPGDYEADGFERYGGYGRLEYDLTPEFGLYASVNLLRAEVEFDDYDSVTFAPDPDNDVQYATHDFVRGQTGAVYDDGPLRIQLDLAATSFEREQPEAQFGSNRWEGEELFAGAHARFYATDEVVLAGGLDYRDEVALARNIDGTDSVDADAQHLGLWGRATYGDARFRVAGTLRGEDHSEQGDAVTWKLEAATWVDQQRIKLFASLGTGFRAPSLYELFSQDVFFLSVPPFGPYGPIGNPDLEPEETIGWEFGHETTPADGWLLTNTAFQTRYEQRIAFEEGSGYVNADVDDRVYGLENEFAYRGGEDVPVDVRLAYTWQRVSDPDSDLADYLPKHVAHVDLELRCPRGFSIGLFGSAFSERTVRSPFLNADFAGYYLLDAVLRWQPDQRWELFLRGENVTDTDYVIQQGYATPGAAAYLGGTVHW